MSVGRTARSSMRVKGFLRFMGTGWGGTWGVGGRAVGSDGRARYRLGAVGREVSVGLVARWKTMPLRLRDSQWPSTKRTLACPLWSQSRREPVALA